MLINVTIADTELYGSDLHCTVLKTALTILLCLADIFCVIKDCQTTIQRLTFFINAIAEDLAGSGVFAGRTLISAFSFRVARYDLI